MAALTSGRITPSRNTRNPILLGVKANAVLQIGGIVLADSLNRLISGAAVTGAIGVGVLLSNPGSFQGMPVVGSSVDRAVQARITPGEFAFDQDGTILASTPYGTAVYAVDDHTVTLTAAGASQIGYFSGGITSALDAQFINQTWVVIGCGQAPAG